MRSIKLNKFGNEKSGMYLYHYFLFKSFQGWLVQVSKLSVGNEDLSFGGFTDSIGGCSNGRVTLIGGAAALGPGRLMKASLGIIVTYLRRNFLYRIVAQPEPSTLTMY